MKKLEICIKGMTKEEAELHITSVLAQQEGTWELAEPAYNIYSCSVIFTKLEF